MGSIKMPLRRVSALVLVASLAACGGSNYDSNKSVDASAGYVLPDYSTDDSAAAEDAAVAGPGTALAGIDETDGTEAVATYDGESAKSFVLKSSTGATKAGALVPRDALNSPAPAVVNLGPVTAAESNAFQQLRSEKQALDVGERQIATGFGRTVGKSIDAQSAGVMSMPLTWTTLDSGAQVGAVTVQSPGAARLRLGLQVTSLPDEARLRFFAPGDSSMVELSGKEVNRNLSARTKVDTDVATRLFWGAVTNGAETTLEIWIPASANSADVSLAINQVMHMASDAKQQMAEAKQYGDSGTCQQDAVCSVSSSGSTADAVTLISYLEYDNFGRAYQFACTGTMIGDNAQSGVPYVLTAEHCVNRQSTAWDMYLTYFYRSATCNSASLDSRAVDIPAWGELLYSASRAKGSDTALIRINPWTELPTDIVLAGWNASVLSSAAPVVSYHHPAMDYLKRSAGTAYSKNSKFLKVIWNQGATEGGSSGSALFNSSNQVIGTLWGGASSCTSPSAPDEFGRFSYAYGNGMRNWLNIYSQQLWAAADTDGDGKRELIFRSSKPGRVGFTAYQAGEVSDSSAALAEWSQVYVDSYFQYEAPVVVAVIDVDGDGREDIVYKVKDSDGLYTIRMLTHRAGQDPATPMLWNKVGPKVTVVGMGDMDGDGYADLVMRDPNSPYREVAVVLVKPQQGYAGQFYGQVVNEDLYFVSGSGKVIKSIYPVAVGNFYGDSRAEIVFKDSAWAPRVVYAQLSGGSFLIEDTSPYIPAKPVGMGDMNGDGKQDLVYLVNGKLRFALSTYKYFQYTYAGYDSLAIPSGSVLVTIADMDNDGKDDTVWRNTKTGKVWFSRSSTAVEGSPSSSGGSVQPPVFNELSLVQ